MQCHLQVKCKTHNTTSKLQKSIAPTTPIHGRSEDTNEIFYDSHVPEIFEHVFHHGFSIVSQDSECKLIVDWSKQLAQDGCLGVEGQSQAAVDETMKDAGRPHCLRDGLLEVFAGESRCLHVTL